MRVTRTMRNISLMYEGLNLDEEQVFHKSKLLLDIYRDVVWKTLKEVEYIKDVCESYYSNDLNAALTYLTDFAPSEQKENFKDRVSYIFETSWMIELIDTAMIKIYDYPVHGKLYHEILSKCYINSITLNEHELLECLLMERTSFYVRKKEAIKLFGVALWGYALPKYKSVFISNFGEKDTNNNLFKKKDEIQTQCELSAY